ncbi:MAG: hypothetical protein J5507_07070 [Clostridia bacterium]|nr:hypothetical protein [Clostridia bacterium]
MKKKFLNLILFFILIILITAIIIFGMYIYKEFFGENTDPILYKVDKIFIEEPVEEPDLEKKLPTENTSVSIAELIQPQTKIEDSEVQNTNQNANHNQNINQNTAFHFFYNQLNNNQKIIYDGLMNNKKYLKQGNYVINYKDAFTNTLLQENGADILGDDYQSAIEAFTHDNVDIFYLDVNKMYLNIETSTKFFKTTYNVYISAASSSNYLSDEFQTADKIEKAILEIEKEKDKIIKHLNGTEHQNILFIHDYLVNNIEYDSTYKSTGSYNIYGALIEKRCVCEGYAKAFKYLTNCAGYNCELMQGVATNSSGESENHAWNCIKLNGIWYQVDTTWDDPIIIGGNGRTNNDIKYRYFLKGSNTFNRDHVLEYQFSDKGKIFSYPSMSISDY